MSRRKRFVIARRAHAGYWLGASLLLLLGSSFALGQLPTQPGSRSKPIRLAQRDSEAEETKKSPEKVHLREGDKITDEIGTFSAQGDLISFESDDKRLKLKALPNLNLERVRNDSQIIEEKAPCVVSGTITEFKKSNYILISRVRKKTLKSGKIDDAK